MTHMLRIFFLICGSVLVTTSLFSQNPLGGMITGKVVDESNRRPMEFVNVMVRRASDSTIAAGMETDSKGNFTVRFEDNV